MQQETADELLGGDRRYLGLFRVPVVFPAKRNLAVWQGYQTLVGDGHAMGVVAEILDHLGRSAAGWHGVHHPCGLADRRQKIERRQGVPQGLQIGEELELAVGISFFESLQKEAAE